MPTILAPLTESPFAQALANHLWQSSLFAFAAALVVLLLRNNQARTRHWIWLAASLKFLVPLSLLFSLGHSLAPKPSQSSAQPASLYALDVASKPFTFLPAQSYSNDLIRPADPQQWSWLASAIPESLAAIWALGFLFVITRWSIEWRRISASIRSAHPATAGREIEAVRRLQEQGLATPNLRLAISTALREPGVFGILRPTLIWPAAFSAHLDDAQMEAILAHELCHARRSDNLSAALHMAVEAVFWFHPFVWWIGARLLHERELACDEAVVLNGHAPVTYAESILKACELCIASPAFCVSGVTGADLKQRIVRIMNSSLAAQLGIGKKTLLAAAAVIAAFGPVLFGAINAPRVHAALLTDSTGGKLPSFEVATVKPSNGSNNRMIMNRPGRLTIRNMPLKSLIEFAFDARSDSQITGGPGWINTQSYDIDAQEDEAQVAAMKKEPQEQKRQLQLMLQSLLIERFHLKVSHGSREVPVYALVVAKGGPKLKRSTAAPPIPSAGPMPMVPRAGHGGGDRGGGYGEGVFMGRGELNGTSAPIARLADVLSRQPETEGRVVVDKTGLTGNYDWTLHWSPETPAPAFKGADADAPPSAPGPDGSGPTLFTALEEQLGLRLESQKGMVDTIVIDSVEKPSEN